MPNNPYNTFPIDTTGITSTSTTTSTNTSPTLHLSGSWQVGEYRTIPMTTTGSGYSYGNDAYGGYIRFAQPKYVGNMPMRQDVNVVPYPDIDVDLPDYDDYISPSINDYTGEQVGYDEETRAFHRAEDRIERAKLASRLAQKAREDANALLNYGIPKINIKINTGPYYNTDMDWIGSRIKVGDMVQTSLGKGKVYVIDEDIYCVELDPASNILHEFGIDELKKI